MSIMIFSSLLSSVFAWGDESRERGSSRKRKERKKKKEEKEGGSQEILQGGTIFGANGYKRGDWPRPIHHRVPPRLFSPSALHFSCSVPSPLPPFFPREGRKKGRVARNKTHPSIHHDPRAVSAVDKQAPNNLMNLSLLFVLFPRFHDRGRAPIVDARNNESPAAETRFISF